MNHKSVIKVSLTLLVTLNSCTAEWHIKRAIKKDPRIIQQAIVKYHTDTLTMIVDGAKGDTVFVYHPSARDTFIMEREKFRTVVITDTLWKTMTVETECFPDTVQKIIRIPQYIMQPQISELNWLGKLQKNIGEFALILFLIITFVVIIKYTLNKVK